MADMTQTQNITTLTTDYDQKLLVRGNCRAAQTRDALRQMLALMSPRHQDKLHTLTDFVVSNIQTDDASLAVAEVMLGDEAAWSLRTSGCWR